MICGNFLTGVFVGQGRLEVNFRYTQMLRKLNRRYFSKYHITVVAKSAFLQLFEIKLQFLRLNMF